MTVRIGLILACMVPPLLAWARPVVAAATADHASLRAVLSRTALRPGDEATIAVVMDIKDGFHAQSNAPLDPNLIAFEVQLAQNPAISPGTVQYPPGQIEQYPGLGTLSVYSGQVIAYVPIRVNPDASPGDLRINGTVTYQICDDKSCYPPQLNRPWSVSTQIIATREVPADNEPVLFNKLGTYPQQRSADTRPAQVATQSPPPSLAGPKRSWSILEAFGAAFLAGLFFNVMPCVLPVLPLKAWGFYEAARHSRIKSLLLGLVFSAGLVAFFAVLAVLILVLKSITWGELYSKPWFVWGIVAILLVMGAGMFGAFTVNLPTGVYNFTPRHDTYGGNFLFGAFTALLSTPCTAPLFPPLMIWAASKPAAIGVPAFMMVGVGMASPYLLLSAFPDAARRLPRTGPMSELVKQMMGFLLLIAATYFAAGQLIHGPGFWWLVLAVVAVAALFLLGRTIQLTSSAAGVAIASIVAVTMVGGVLTWSVRATGVLRQGGAATSSAMNWTPYSDEALRAARQSGRIALVKFTANWCANCQYIEASVFGDPAIWDKLDKAGVVLLKADMTHANPPARKLLVKLNPAGGIPLTAIYSPAWSEPLVLDSVYTSSTLLGAIEQAKTGSATAAP